jgi:hypothetical protein
MRTTTTLVLAMTILLVGISAIPAPASADVRVGVCVEGGGPCICYDVVHEQHTDNTCIMVFP